MVILMFLEILINNTLCWNCQIKSCVEFYGGWQLCATKHRILYLYTTKIQQLFLIQGSRVPYFRFGYHHSNI